MLLAPTPPLYGQVYHLPGGLAGIEKTIRVMRNLVNSYRVNLPLREQAKSIIWLTPERDSLAEVSALYEFVRDRVRYVRDVHDVETISSPDKVLAGKMGDCDDQAVLLATMLESVGYPTRFIVAGYSIPGEFEHVYLQVLVGHEWLDLDPTEHFPMGVAPPNPVSLMAENIPL